MNAAHREVWVLWAERFDEATAALFVTEMRAAGLRTRLVSLGRRVAAGSHGLALVADWTLEEALAQRQDVACLVIPAQMEGWQRLINDPRVNILFDRLASGRAALVIGPPEGASLAQGVGLTWEAYAPGPELIETAQRCAQRVLAGRGPAANGVGRRLSGSVLSAVAAV